MLKEFFRSFKESLVGAVPLVEPVWLPTECQPGKLRAPEQFIPAEIADTQARAWPNPCEMSEWAVRERSALWQVFCYEKKLSPLAFSPTVYDQFELWLKNETEELSVRKQKRIEDLAGFLSSGHIIRGAGDLTVSPGLLLGEADLAYLRKNRSPFKVVLAHPNAKAPQRATDGSGAYDIFLPEDIEVRVWKVTKARTGLRLQIPEGFVGLILPRSSTGFRDGVDVASFLPADRYEFFPGSEPPREDVYDSVAQPNRIGVIDSDYRGEVFLALTRTTEFGSEREVLKYKAGDRVAQLLLIPVGLCPVDVVDALDPAPSRGENGFGSTGK